MRVRAMRVRAMRAFDARARGGRRCGKLDKAASVMYNIGIGAMVCAVRVSETPSAKPPPRPVRSVSQP